MGITNLNGNSNSLNNNIKPESNQKQVKPNILNIYVVGNYQQIKLFENCENLNIMNKEFMSLNLDENNYHGKYNWIYCDEFYSEQLMDKILSNIIKIYQKKEVCNIILILSDCSPFDNKSQDIYKSALKCLEKTKEIYKPIVILAYKKQIISKEIIANQKDDKKNLDKKDKFNDMDIDECFINDDLKKDIIQENNKDIILEKENSSIKNEANIDLKNFGSKTKFDKTYGNKVDETEVLTGNENNQLIEIKGEKNSKLSKGDIEIQNEKQKKFKIVSSIKYIEIVSYKDNDYSEIKEKIYSIYCYYNNIGDIYSIINEMMKQSEFNKDNNNIVNYKATLNILVIGRPGGGKSTLINLLLNERKAREGIGASITKIFSKYVHSKYPITFVDTPGFEKDNDLNKMIEFLRQSKKFFGDGKFKFHLILYVINASNERFFIGEENLLITEIIKINIPIFFVCTRSRNEDHALDFKEILKINLFQNFPNIPDLTEHIYCCHLLNEKDGDYKKFGVDTLLQSIHKYLKVEINDIKIIKSNFENGSSYILLNSPKNHQILLNTLNQYDNFEKYLTNLSDEIIRNYKNLTMREENKKKNNDKYNEQIISIDKINELLVKHLAFELDGDISKLNINEIKNKIISNLNDEMKKEGNSQLNQHKKADKIIIIDKITERLGLYIKNVFLQNLKQRGINEYFQSIIDNYQKAIDSLLYLDK